MKPVNNRMNKLKNKMRKTMICQVQLLFQFFKDINTNGDQIFRKKFEFKHFITTITI